MNGFVLCVQRYVKTSEMQKKKVIEACQVFDLGQKRELFAHTITKNSLPVPKNQLTFASSKGTKAWRQG
jgi:hypothetical protein